MGNNTGLYIGAYLEISVIPMPVTRSVMQCSNGHETYTKVSFCPQCGEAVTMADVTKDEMPTQVIGLLDDEWEDVLQVITPPSLYGTGVILAASNDGETGHWYTFSRYNWAAEIKSLPSAAEADELCNNLETVYHDIIQALRSCPYVTGVITKTGIVVDAEY